MLLSDIFMKMFIRSAERCTEELFCENERMVFEIR